jgi:hypothetical protein
LQHSQDQIKDFEPDFTVINACSEVNAKWKEHGLNSEVAVAFNIEKKVAVILGTKYGGENKKGIFSLMNYWYELDIRITVFESSQKTSIITKFPLPIFTVPLPIFTLYFAGCRCRARWPCTAPPTWAPRCAFLLKLL